jgi:hypothetical protein
LGVDLGGVLLAEGDLLILGHGAGGDEDNQRGGGGISNHFSIGMVHS